MGTQDATYASGTTNAADTRVGTPIPDAEKTAAVKWLGHLYGAPNSVDEKHLRTLKDMLAEPRLPAEPSEEMLDAMWRGYEKTPGSDYRRHHGSYSNLYAHLTKPTTKAVWRVSWDGGYTECTTPEMLAREIHVRTIEQGRTITIKAQEVPA